MPIVAPAIIHYSIDRTEVGVVCVTKTEASVTQTGGLTDIVKIGDTVVFTPSTLGSHEIKYSVINL